MAERETKAKETKKQPAQSPKGEGKRKGAGEGISYEIEAGRPRGPARMPRLQALYNEKIVPALMKEFGFKNRMQVPRLDKIVVSTCLREALVNPKALDNAMEELALITGQRAGVARAKKSIAAFKLREGQALGATVTLRKARMYEFLDRLLNVALPRVRDFKGSSPNSFDGRGNYSLGIKEQIIFPEINYDKVDKVRGMNVTIGTRAKNDTHARALLSAFGMPFRRS